MRVAGLWCQLTPVAGLQGHRPNSNVARSAYKGRCGLLGSCNAASRSDTGADMCMLLFRVSQFTRGGSNTVGSLCSLSSTLNSDRGQTTKKMEGLLKELEAARQQSGGRMVSLDAITATESALQADGTGRVSGDVKEWVWWWIVVVCVVGGSSTPTRRYIQILIRHMLTPSASNSPSTTYSTPGGGQSCCAAAVSGSCNLFPNTDPHAPPPCHH